MDDQNNEAEGGPQLKAAILEVLDNQLRDDDPPETRATLERLLASGIAPDEARRHIACVIAAEVFDVMRNGSPFDRERYISRLARLPEEPWFDDEDAYGR